MTDPSVLLALIDGAIPAPPGGPALTPTAAVCRLLGLSQRSVRRLVAADKLPRPVVLGKTCHRFPTLPLRDCLIRLLTEGGDL